MKPIYLSLSGLQSYREKQEIDFTKLCDAGVFGIFGPTGSGKSSILDAMTLALFGKVERASNGTQGILNHAENALAVAFEFELAHANGPQRYRVERQFKRGADVSVNNTVSRLIDVKPEGSIVLADKARDVDGGIQEILGLSMQDFTRAVVLPQGKFAEFLSLKGSDRRQMLQRLFHLEAYGDLLNMRLSRKFKAADSDLKQTAARLEGLGDASESAVEAADERLKLADEAAQDFRKRRQEAEMEWEGLKQILGLQQELADLTTRQAKQAHLGPQMAERESRLKQADRASRIRPYLNEWEAAGGLQKDCRERQELLRVELTELERAAGEADREFSEAREALGANDAALQVKLEQLNQAMALESEIRHGDEHVEARAAYRTSQAALLAECLEKLAKEQDIQAKALKKQADLKLLQQENEVKPEFRQKLAAASADRRQLEELNRQEAALEREFREHGERLKASRKEADSAVALLLPINSEMRRLQAEGITWESRLSLLEDWHAACRTAVQHAAEAAGRRAAERDHARLAAQLAVMLSDGEPCPVCGSAHHPVPALLASSDVQEDELPPERFARLAAASQERLFALKQMGLKLRHSLEQAGGLVAEIRSQMAVEEAGIPAAIQEVEFRESETAPDNEAAAALDLSLVEWIRRDPLSLRPEDLEPESVPIRLLEEEAERFVRECDERVQELARKCRQASRDGQQAEAQLQAAQSLGQNLLERQTQLRSRLEELSSRWNAGYPAWTPETVARELELLDEKDRSAEELKQKLTISVDFLEQKLKAINDLKQQASDSEKELVKADTEIAGMTSTLAEKRRQLEERAGTGDGTVAERMETVKRQLESLRTRERETRERMERRQQDLQALSHRHTAAKQACESADSAYGKAEANWLEALAKTEFVHADEAREALLPEETFRAWDDELRLYRERTAEINAALQQVKQKLNGRAVGEEDRLAGENKLNEARRLDEEALEQRARALRDLEELQSKHRVWLELEREKAKLQEACGNLSRLQQVFRGNTFVEFLAEEQLMQVSRSASERLGQLTRQRYGLEVDSQGGFVIRDDANGGVKRPVGSLSGGETFLTSLSLALALSSQIQLSGQYPLEFFFLDEGFGTLDPDLLETVVGALEKLHVDRLTVGVISHVPELKARLPRRLVVESAEPTGIGSRIRLELN